MILPDVLQKMTDEEFLFCVFGVIYKELGISGLARFLKTFRNDEVLHAFTLDGVVARLEVQKEGESALTPDIFRQVKENSVGETPEDQD